MSDGTARDGVSRDGLASDRRPRGRPERGGAPVGRTPIWLAPQVLVAALLVLAALAYALRPQPAPEPPPTVALRPQPEAPAEPAEVELALVEDGGLERIVFARVRLPDAEAGAYAAIMAALREALVDAGVWPEEVPAPRVFVQPIAGSDVLVVDLEVPAGVTADVEAELRMVRSIEATAERHDARVRYLVNGAATDTLLGHVAVPSALTTD